MAKKDNIFEKVLSQITDLKNQFEKSYSEAINPKKIASQFLELDEAASKVANEFGVGRENIDRINKGLTDSITNVILLGGKWSDVGRIQTEISKDLGRNVISTSETIESLFRTSQVTGQDSATLSKNFKDVGFSAGMIEKQMEKVVNSAREIGVSSTKVSSEAIRNLDAMNKYNFQGGVDGLAKMAAQAVSLRVSMTDTLRIADGLFSPEKAIEMAAGLQRLGVAQSDLLDPLRLMELGQNDPTELQNQIAQMTKQFVQLNEKGQFEIMPGAKLKLRELEKEMSMPYGTLTNMALAGAELEDKLAKIKFPEGAFTDEQQQFIANIAEMDKNGQYKIEIDGKSMGIEEAMKEFKDSPDKLEQIMKDQAPKTMEELAKDQLSTQKIMAKQLEAMATVGYSFGASKTGKDTADILRGTSRTVGQITRGLGPVGAVLGPDTKTQSRKVDVITDSVGDLLTVLTGTGSFEEKMKTLITVAGDAGTAIKENLDDNIRKIGQDASKTFSKLNEDNNKFVNAFEAIYKSITGKEITYSSENKTGKSDSNVVYQPEKQEVKPMSVKQDESIKQVSTEYKITSEKTEDNNKPLEIILTINHDLKNVPSEIDTEKLKAILNDPKMTDAITKSIDSLKYNYGLTKQK